MPAGQGGTDGLLAAEQRDAAGAFRRGEGLVGINLALKLGGERLPRGLGGGFTVGLNGPTVNGGDASAECALGGIEVASRF